MEPLPGMEKLKRVTIVAESVVAERIQEDVLRLGAKGYTTTHAEGRGSRGVRASEWEGHNVKLETIVTPEVAGKILKYMEAKYFEHFAVIAYTIDVEVIRAKKYR
jgi:nitrogen regulatory protein P-II 2